MSRPLWEALEVLIEGLAHQQAMIDESWRLPWSMMKDALQVPCDCRRVEVCSRCLAVDAWMERAPTPHRVEEE